MTTVTLKETDDTFTFVCEGHAGYAPAGGDIVCAGISTLITTLAETASALIGTELIYADLSPGYSEVTVRIKFPAVGETLLRTIQTGFELLAESYPQYVSIGR